MLKKFIGNKQFYKTLLVVCIPIVLSQLITQFVGLLDNLMVGQLSPAEYNGVAIANQFMFIFNLAVFGATAGPSIFATQYHGAKNIEGVKETIRYKWIISIVILLIGILVFTLFDDSLFNLFIHEENLDSVNPADVIKYGKEYLSVMIFGLFPFVITEIYSTNLREAKQTFVPMLSNIIAVVLNLVLNYILIFGNFGFPALGVKGAAIATVISRFIGCAVVVIFAHCNKKYNFVNCIFKRFLPSKSSFVNIFKGSYLLLINEFLWSFGMTLLNYCFSFKGLEVVAAMNIVSTVSNLFGLLGTSVGIGISVILGQQLGSNQLNEAKEDSDKYIFFAIILGIFITVLMFFIKDPILSLYKFDRSILDIASTLIIISSAMVVVRTYSITCYFIIRSGGKIFITFLFDSVFTIVIRFGVTFLFVQLTDLNIFYIYFISEILEIIKIIIGTILVKKGIWVNKLD